MRLVPTGKADTAIRPPGAARWSVRKVPWVLAVPAVAAMVLIRFVPSAFGAMFAFTDWDGVGLRAGWNGVANFRRIFADPITSRALRNTFQLTIMLVAIANALGIALALSLRAQLKSRNLIRALFFLPFALSHLASGYIWQFIFQYDGPLNRFLRVVGLDGWQRTWLADPTWSLYTILAVLVWQYTGLTLIIYLAGLEGIPSDLDDAAAMDGASRWLKFRRVTFPLLAPAITVATTLTLIFGFSAFDQVLALTGGGPVNSTETLATQVWRHTWTYGRYGYGSALALILAGVVATVAITQVTLLRYRESRL